MLKLKKRIHHFDTEPVETIWPGDEAVDYKVSDLVTWCREGGRAGLVLREGKEPTIIKMRAALGERALTPVFELMAQRTANAHDEAFRFGLLSVRNGDKSVRLSWDNTKGVRGLTDEWLDELSLPEHRCNLPYLIALDEMDSALGSTSDTPSDPEELAKWKEERERLLPSTLPRVLGMQILARTFRQRRDHA